MSDSNADEMLLREMREAGLIAPDATLDLPAAEDDVIVLDDVPEDELDDLAREIEVVEAREDAYAMTDAGEIAGIAGVDEAIAAVGATVRSKPRKEKAERKPREPGEASKRTPRLGEGETAGAYAAKLLGEAPMPIADIVERLPVKVKEKAINLAEHVASGKRLSVFTQAAIKLLGEHGRVSQRGLKDALMAQGYSNGTAASQAGQMFALLPNLGIAVREGVELAVAPEGFLRITGDNTVVKRETADA